MRRAALFLFSVFALAACSDGGGGECIPRTCAAFSVQCGPFEDGCGNSIDCGACPSGKECNPFGVCEAPCVPKTCEAQGATCGRVSDGCRRMIDCGSCGPGEICGGATVANTCATPPDPCAAGAWTHYGDYFFETSCKSCHAHYASLTETRRDSKVRGVVASGEMPRDRTLSEAEKQWVLEWIDCGMKE